MQDFPLLPAEFKPRCPVTNRGLFGYAFDRDTSPPALGLLHVNAGELAASGDPRDWVDGGVTPVARLAETFGQEPSNGVEWYFPKRLTIDTNGANELKQNDVADFLGLRLDAREADRRPDLRLPDRPHRRRRPARRQARWSSGRRRSTREAMLVDGAPQQSHLDPLTAAPKRNEFLKHRDRVPRPAAMNPVRGPALYPPLTSVPLGCPNRVLMLGSLSGSASAGREDRKVGR